MQHLCCKCNQSVSLWNVPSTLFTPSDLCLESFIWCVFAIGNVFQFYASQKLMERDAYRNEKKILCRGIHLTSIHHVWLSFSPSLSSCLVNQYADPSPSPENPSSTFRLLFLLHLYLRLAQAADNSLLPRASFSSLTHLLLTESERSVCPPSISIIITNEAGAVGAGVKVVVKSYSHNGIRAVEGEQLLTHLSPDSFDSRN